MPYNGKPYRLQKKTAAVNMTCLELLRHPILRILCTDYTSLNTVSEVKSFISLVVGTIRLKKINIIILQHMK